MSSHNVDVDGFQQVSEAISPIDVVLDGLRFSSGLESDWRGPCDHGVVIFLPHDEEETRGREDAAYCYNDPLHCSYDTDDEEEIQYLVNVFLVQLHVLQTQQFFNQNYDKNNLFRII